MEPDYDVIVLGLGAMGVATVDRLAAGGLRVLGLERFSPGHDRGSSHGETRVIRKAYFEDPRYVPLLLRAYGLWEELEDFAATRLLEKCGCVVIGQPASPVLRGCLEAARSAGLPCERIGPPELRQRFGYAVGDDVHGVYEPDGGYLRVDACLESFRRRALAAGAELHFETRVRSWSVDGTGVRIESERGGFTAARLVLCPGAWAGSLVDAALPLAPRRVCLFWFDAGAYPDSLPVFFRDTESGPWMYGFPPIEREIKLAFHNVHSACDPDTVDRTVSTGEIARIEEHARALFPELGAFRRATTCLYTMTPDEHFILGPPDPRTPQVFLAGGFSGHGFKFAPVVGEVVAQWADGGIRHDVGFLAPSRF